MIKKSHDFIIRRGTTKSLAFTLDCCEKLWTDLGTLKVRLQQGQTVVDKTMTVDTNDKSKAYVTFTQEETLQFKEGDAEFQIFILKGPRATEVATKSEVYQVEIARSLWDTAVHNG